MEPLRGFTRRAPWSLLQAQWLDVPINKDTNHASPTWEVFSETFGVCLWGVSEHLSRRVDDRRRLESLVTRVLVDNLEVLASHDGDREKLHRLLTAADLLLDEEAPPES
jgi:hypothetical protein